MTDTNPLQLFIFHFMIVTFESQIDISRNLPFPVSQADVSGIKLLSVLCKRLSLCKENTHNVLTTEVTLKEIILMRGKSLVEV